MMLRCITIGIIALVLGGVFYFLSYPTDSEIEANEKVRAVLLDLYSTPGLADRDKYEEIKRMDPEDRKSKFVLGANISFGVGGVLLILGFIVGRSSVKETKEGTPSDTQD
jgi:hypothetical protein